MPQTLSVARHRAFNIALVTAMSLTFLTYFLALPVLPDFQTRFGISKKSAMQMATVYEGGKCIGTLVLGYVGANRDTLRMILVSFAVYVVLAMATGLYWAYGPASVPSVGFVLFSATSAASVSSQFGLAVLRQSNTGDRFAFWVAVSGIVAVCLQGASPLAGSSIRSLFQSLVAPFALMASAAVFSIFFLIFGNGCQTQTPEDPSDQQPSQQQQQQLLQAAADACTSTCNDACTSSAATASAAVPTPSNQSKSLPSSPRSNLTYRQQLWSLAVSESGRTFRVYAFVMSCSTVALYLFPLAATFELTELGVSPFDISCTIALTFIPNLIARLIATFKPHLATLLVYVGIVALVLGSIIWVTFEAALSSFDLASLGGRSMRMLISGLVLQFGVGAIMPNCKVLCLAGMPKEISSTAASALKFVQIALVTVVMLIAADSNKLLLQGKLMLVVALLCVAAVGVDELMKFCSHRSRDRIQLLPTLNSGVNDSSVAVNARCSYQSIV